MGNSLGKAAEVVGRLKDHYSPLRGGGGVSKFVRDPAAMKVVSPCSVGAFDSASGRRGEI